MCENDFIQSLRRSLFKITWNNSGNYLEEHTRREFAARRVRDHDRSAPMDADVKIRPERENRRSLTEYSVTRVNRCKCRDGSNSLPRDDIASRRAARPTHPGIGSCEAGLTPATLPAETIPGTGMPCVKMPPCLCAQIVCVCVS
ncbi:hypothetical protein ACS0PU_009897 [Formica fusca]